MQAESAKQHCEICGGDHSTGACFLVGHKIKSEVQKNKELSPEALKKIMDKVQDINRPGIGFSGLGAMSSDKLHSLFSNGILGDNNRAEEYKELQLIVAAEKQGENPTKLNLHQEYKELPAGEEALTWAQRTRRDKNTIIHFNITGRMDETKRVWEQRNDPKWKNRFTNYLGDGEIQSQIDMVSYTKRRNGITILFDPSNFKESTEPEGLGYQVQPRPKTFRPDGQGRDKSKPEFEYGHILWHRVAPKYFSGLFLRVHEPMHVYTDAEVKQKLEGWVDPNRPDFQQIVEDNKKRLNEEEERTLRDETNPALIQQRIQEVVNTMTEVYKDKPEMMVPIYGRAGNLLWPKQMNYEEVKKFVDERGLNSD